MPVRPGLSRSNSPHDTGDPSVRGRSPGAVCAASVSSIPTSKAALIHNDLLTDLMDGESSDSANSVEERRNEELAAATLQLELLRAQERVLEGGNACC